MTFKPHKRSDTKPDLIHHPAKPSALGAFNQTLLFKGAMIHLNPPSTFGFDFPLSFGHLLKACRPVFRCAVCGANPKYFDLSETLEPDQRAVPAAQSGIDNGAQTALVAFDLPIRLQARQKMSRKGAN